MAKVDYERRKRMLAIIQPHGITRAELVASGLCTSGSAAWHLRAMEEAGQIVAVCEVRGVFVWLLRKDAARKVNREAAREHLLAALEQRRASSSERSRNACAAAREVNEAELDVYVSTVHRAIVPAGSVPPPFTTAAPSVFHLADRLAKV